MKGNCIGIKEKEGKNYENKKEFRSIHNTKTGIDKRTYKKVSNTSEK